MHSWKGSIRCKSEAALQRPSCKQAPPPFIAISATFTSEPVSDSLRFWLHDLEYDYELRFAPFNQVFQQLLEPASLLGSNRDSVNVLLIRFADWGGDRARLRESRASAVSCD